MVAITFDTLAYSKTLQAAGMPAEQAEAFAKAQKNALDEMVAAKELATKMDVLQVEMRLSHKLEANKHEILKWMTGMLIAQTAMLVAVIAFIK
ncbi:MAG: hypothetical protein IJD16_07350 [Desulfovibrio sp.]|nr:hypothetical protein [Desulfovibrio sp.]